MKTFFRIRTCQTSLSHSACAYTCVCVRERERVRPMTFAKCVGLQNTFSTLLTRFSERERMESVREPSSIRSAGRVQRNLNRVQLIITLIALYWKYRGYFWLKTLHTWQLIARTASENIWKVLWLVTPVTPKYIYRCPGYAYIRLFHWLIFKSWKVNYERKLGSSNICVFRQGKEPQTERIKISQRDWVIHGWSKFSLLYFSSKQKGIAATLHFLLIKSIVANEFQNHV